MPLEVAMVVHEMGLGGTEKALYNHVLAFDRSCVRPRVIELHSAGPRAALLRQAGVDVVCVHGDERRLAQALAGVQVAHAHRGGFAEPLLPAACRTAGVPHLVETNVFGFLDQSADEPQFDFHLFVSQMCALRYRAAAGIPREEFPERHLVAYNPIDVEGLQSRAPDREAACRLLGLDPARRTVGRLGRADDRKWDTILVDMLPRLFELRPQTQVLFVGATNAIRARLRRRGVFDRVTLLEPTGDEERLAVMYRACDVFATASSIGESFGVGIAEAMALGLPVVTSSTPWTDNAQVELVDNGVTGYVANHPRAFAEAAVTLLDDTERRTSFGSAAADKARARFDAALLTRQLERLYESLAAGGRAPEGWTPSPTGIDRFERDYPRRAAAQFRPLTTQERVEVRLRVARDRARWMLHDLRGTPLSHLRAILTMAVGKRLRSLAGRRTAA